MKTILCFGDSNTYGTPPMKHLSDEGRFDKTTRWPMVMAGELGEAWEVIEAGLPGRTTVHDDPLEGAYRNGKRSLRAVIESHRPIDLLILMLGTNDHKARFSVGAQDIAFGAGKLVDLALATGFVEDVLLISPPRVLERGSLAEMFKGAEAKSANLAKHMLAVAKARGVGFWDAAERIESDPIDGVHFSKASHVTLGQELAGFVQAHY